MTNEQAKAIRLTEAQQKTIRFAADALEGLDYEDTAGDLRDILTESATAAPIAAGVVPEGADVAKGLRTLIEEHRQLTAKANEWRDKLTASEEARQELLVAANRAIGGDTFMGEPFLPTWAAASGDAIGFITEKALDELREKVNDNPLSLWPTRNSRAKPTIPVYLALSAIAATESAHPVAGAAGAEESAWDDPRFRKLTYELFMAALNIKSSGGREEKALANYVDARVASARAPASPAVAPIIPEAGAEEPALPENEAHCGGENWFTADQMRDHYRKGWDDACVEIANRAALKGSK